MYTYSDTTSQLRRVNLSSPGRRSASQISQGDPATEKSKNPIEIVQTNISKLRRFLLQRLRELLVPSFRSRQPAASSPQVGLERKYSTLSTNTKTEKEKMFLCKQKRENRKQTNKSHQELSYLMLDLNASIPKIQQIKRKKRREIQKQKKRNISLPNVQIQNTKRAAYQQLLYLKLDCNASTPHNQQIEKDKKERKNSLLILSWIGANALHTQQFWLTRKQGKYFFLLFSAKSSSKKQKNFYKSSLQKSRVHQWWM